MNILDRINEWLDGEVRATLVCSSAKSREAALGARREALGLSPDVPCRVVQATHFGSEQQPIPEDQVVLVVTASGRLWRRPVAHIGWLTLREVD